MVIRLFENNMDSHGLAAHLGPHFPLPQKAILARWKAIPDHQKAILARQEAILARQKVILTPGKAIIHVAKFSSTDDRARHTFDD